MCWWCRPAIKREQSRIDAAKGASASGVRRAEMLAVNCMRLKSCGVAIAGTHEDPRERPPSMVRRLCRDGRRILDSQP